ncbi:hypothetical protein DUB86_10145, partial [Salmonella enterica subsp. enterica serovar Havana]|nr:hypothetical protein [Salmonella enterica subsp. enterica serovar Havana]
IKYLKIQTLTIHSKLLYIRQKFTIFFRYINSFVVKTIFLSFMINAEMSHSNPIYGLVWIVL